MQKIQLTLKNTKVKSYYIIIWLIAVLSLITQAYLTFTYRFTHDKVLVGSILVVIVLFLVIMKGNSPGFKDKNYQTGFVYALICFIWFKWHLYWIFSANVLFYFLYKSAIRKFEISFLPDKIIYPSIPKRNILWNELQNVILKDGILTLNFKNDKILQSEITDDDFVSEKEFNDFCHTQLRSASITI